MNAIADGSALDPEVGAVLCGLDFHVNYLKLALALAYIRRGAEYLVTNADSTIPMGVGGLFPGAGSIHAVLTTALAGMASGSGSGSGDRARDRPITLGKPSKEMMDAVEGKLRDEDGRHGILDRARTCMIGDRLNTDILFGIETGLGGTLLVLTGVTRREEVEGDAEKEILPSAYADKIGDLLLGAA